MHGRIQEIRRVGRKYKNQIEGEREGSADFIGFGTGRLDGSSLPIVLPAVALPFLLAGESGVGRSATAEVVGVGAAESIGAAGAGVVVTGPRMCGRKVGQQQRQTPMVVVVDGMIDQRMRPRQGIENEEI
ncbi:hypothetical protein V6N11_044972 [Hibiscus sabdariffa]|uniref:Uncharacterized protein n=1 Tax=Hibiscus sabdariffa TaxID=183260 RepID=A0ABR2PUH1_9ROSI